ncbi:hypothetical protein F1880_007850 [Penicillium rolfsii]|nr:hypothetical protein F1880_007850 [Penicillium rolfsii]
MGSDPSRGFATIQYYLEAIMTTLDSGKPCITRMPVKVRCEPSPFPITDFDIALHSRQRYIVTPNSHSPGIERTRISTAQRIAQVFRSSKAPRFAFRLEMTVASVLQSNSPYHIPFLLRATPDWEDTSDSFTNMPQILNINEFTLTLRSTPSIIGFAQVTPGAAALVHEAQSATKIILGGYTRPTSTAPTRNDHHAGLDLKACALGDHPPSYSNSLSLPIAEDSEPLNLGQILDLKLGNQLRVQEVPTFITYNIKQTYDLEWKISLAVAGEIVKVKGKRPVLIMETAGKDSGH